MRRDIRLTCPGCRGSIEVFTKAGEAGRVICACGGQMIPAVREDGCPQCGGSAHGATEPCPNTPALPFVEIDRGPHPAALLAWIGIAFCLAQLVWVGSLLVQCWRR